MTRDVWAERRELLEYVLKEHTRRGGRVVAVPQTAVYESKVLDQLNITALLKQLYHGGTIELGRILLPPSSISAGGSNPVDRTTSMAVGSNRSSGAGDNPFASPLPTLTTSASMSSLNAGRPSTENPFGPPPGAGAPPGPRHSSHVSSDNPFGSGGGATNAFSKPAARPSTGIITAVDAAMFSHKKSSATSHGGNGGANSTAAAVPGEPPIATITTSTKLSYITQAPQRGPVGPLEAASTRRRLDSDGLSGEDVEGASCGPSVVEGCLVLPRLNLPQLESGQTDDQLRDLAYLLFAAVAVGTCSPQHCALLPVMRQQLGVEESRAADVARVLKHIQPCGDSHLIDQPHPVFGGASPGGWRPSQRASLELLLRLITVVRPVDFEATTPATAFGGFLRWKDVSVAVLERQVAAAVAASWTGDKTQLRKMLARMHGAARRADVRGEGDFEEEEYSEATRVLAEVSGQLAAGCSTGLRFPWAVRVRMCEILVTTLFDTQEPGTYIDEAALVLQFLDAVFFPALGLSPSAALAVNTWVHFSLYVGTGCKEQRLVKQLKQHISRLATAAAEAPLRVSDPFGLAAEGGGGPPTPAEEQSRDASLAAQVANHIVEWVYTRLCDYHAAFPRGEKLAALLDVFVFACKSRGDQPPRLAELLVGAVCRSTTAALQQRTRARIDSAASHEMRLLDMASIAHDLHDEDATTYGPTLAQHLAAAALAVAATKTHQLYGQHLAPWLAMPKVISPAVLDVFRTANVLEQRLMGLISKAGSGAAGDGGGGGLGGSPPLPPAASEVLSSFRRWDLSSPLKAALLQWVATQVNNMTTWTARALQTEKWRPLGSGLDASHTASAAEVSRMILDALDALYGMDVPMSPEVVQALLEGVDAVLRRYVTHVNDKLGALQRLIPPVPPLVRYKKDLVMKNEQAEQEAGRSSARGGSKAKMHFLTSVPPVESSPDFTNMSASLTPEVLTAAACSLYYLYARAEALIHIARERQQQSCSAHGPPQPAPPAPPVPPPSPHKVPTDLESAKASPTKSDGSDSIGEAPEPLAQARVALMTGMQYACKFLATRVVFWDYRTPWLELLYRHHVTLPGSRLEPLVLESLHGVLAATCPGLPDCVRTAFARHLLAAAMQAFERVLLDGGTCRWFMPADVLAIDQDLHKLRALFHAEGEGLNRELIDAELERLRRLLPLMSLEVGPLMDLIKTARTHGTAQLLPSTGGPPLVFDESTLLRVLVHRPERYGSKMLKTVYKLPKKAK